MCDEFFFLYRIIIFSENANSFFYRIYIIIDSHTGELEDAVEAPWLWLFSCIIAPVALRPLHILPVSVALPKPQFKRSLAKAVVEPYAEAAVAPISLILLTRRCCS